jgi:hypothetical protein
LQNVFTLSHSFERNLVGVTSRPSRLMMPCPICVARRRGELFISTEKTKKRKAALEAALVC